MSTCNKITSCTWLDLRTTCLIIGAIDISINGLLRLFISLLQFGILIKLIYVLYIIVGVLLIFAILKEKTQFLVYVIILQGFIVVLYLILFISGYVDRGIYNFLIISWDIILGIFVILIVNAYRKKVNGTLPT
uniref:Uncharacterized protein n=1 Tax=Megaselia scalaris TaxID=36166 RepID=T1GG61_MEGSC